MSAPIYDDSEWRLKTSVAKVAVVFLNQATDFATWHIALRRLVTVCNMADALLFSVPSNQLGAVKERITANTKIERVKQEAAEASSAKDSWSGSSARTTSPLSPDPTTPMFLDLTEEKALPPAQRSEADLVCLKSLGISKTQDEFFSSTVQFTNSRTGEPESDKAGYYRHEVWQWMEQSLSKGIYKWVVRTISPMYDIHSLYNKVVSLANKATWISHALEFKKIFSISSTKSDIFTYHAELIQQIKLVRMQGETLGLNADVPAWMEQSLLLIAAWQNPAYQKIAREFSMEGKIVSVETLVRELQRQDLLRTHLNQSGGEKARKWDSTDVVRVRAASASTPKYCFGFQKGKCVRVDCPFLHEQSPAESKFDVSRAKPKQKPSIKKSSVKKQGSAKKGRNPNPSAAPRRKDSVKGKPCGKCGGGHPVSECKYVGVCEFCAKSGPYYHQYDQG
jgi:hypothetical protein